VEQFITVDTRQNIERLSAELEGLFKHASAGNIVLSISGDPEENLAYLLCGYPKGASAQFKRYIAEAIAGLIINSIEGLLAYNILEQNYYFPVSEREEIYREILKHTGERKKSSGYSFLYRMHRRSAILKILLDYITTADMIMIKGFIRFRLKDYLIELTEIVDKAVDNFLLEKDYTEFIHLLRRLKETNEPRVDIVHVVFSEGFFKLFDKRGKVIKGDLLGKADIEQSQNEAGYGDLLISLLVSLVPGQIMFHSCCNDQTAAVQKIIRDIFTGQFKECDGCNLCLKN